jgi:hypothetical protein
MPYKDPERFRQYQEQRRLERLALATARLGGKCVRCGATESLDFDHIVASTKNRKISEATNWSMERFLAEVDKCQLLCHAGQGCKGHSIKTTESGEHPHGEAHSRARLTETDVRAIRASTETGRTLAAKYGMGHATISDIRLRKIWKHVQ